MSARFIITSAKLHIFFVTANFYPIFFKIKSVCIKVQTSNWLYNSILHAVYQFIVSFFKKTAALKPTFMYIYKVHFKAMYRRTSATVSYARMTMTVAGLPSRWQESTAFPFIVAPPFVFSRGALRHSSAPFSFSPLHVCLRFHAAFRTASACHFRCWGKGKDGIRNTNFLSKNLHTLSGVVFCRKKFANPTP